MTSFVLMAGLPGSGKTTLAVALAERLNGVVLSKDTVRAALFPRLFTDYTREQDDLVFRAVLEAAGYLAARNRAGFVFLDGRTFSRSEQLDDAIRAAESVGCAWRILHAVCPDSLAEARLVQDAANHPATNRTVEMYREVKARFEPILRPHHRIDTSEPLEACIERALKYLRATDKNE